jgi:hypothetical protein
MKNSPFLNDIYTKIKLIKLKCKSIAHRNYIEVKGYCPICESSVIFRSDREWLRDYFLCSKCGSIPRERALIEVIKKCYPEYKNLKIHESSPKHRGASKKLKNECKDYSFSHYYSDTVPGEINDSDGYRCENIEKLTFQDNEFDLFITQDVMEHIFHPDKAFQEISRVLKHGGAHVFTVPLVNKNKKSEIRASIYNENKIIYHHEPEYHGNPINKKGALVTMYWGYDITEFIIKESGTPTEIIYLDELEKGIRAEYIEVLVSRKQ